MSGVKVKVVVVDDHPLFRKGLAITLAGEPDLEVIGEAGTADELRSLARLHAIDVAIVDVLMPDISGIGILHELHELAPRCRALGLSVIDEPCLIADMLRAGAYGYALKTQPTIEIVEAVRRVAGGVRYLPPGVSVEAIEAELGTPTPQLVERLTKREREVFELIIRGHGNGDIATRLFIALRTVETHRQRIMKKVSARTVAEIQRVAAQHGGMAR